MTTDAEHTYWSEPGALRSRLAELPSEPRMLPDALENFLIHHAVARYMNLGVPAQAESDRDLRTVVRLLDRLTRRDGRHLSEHRALPDYLYGTCHDFALLATSVLREAGVPARLRVGCASYFRPGYWDDHWICEYRRGLGWAVLDAQLGPRARTGFGIGFDVSDVPADGWRPAAAIWRAIRAGTVDERICGLTNIGIEGRWFVASAVLRDAAALAGIETLPWDYWGPGHAFRETRQVSPEQARDIDALAAALDPAPAGREEAEAVLARFTWARPTPTVWSLPEGRPTEDVRIRP
ncbi:MAG TPA: transglutaminase-like domain-containing protein [Acetobacteraceae bacterium]|nr:transglutaminase-like domain-containing protein [Acetobacteraceae bacterium]